MDKFDRSFVSVIDDAFRRYADQPCLCQGDQVLSYGEVDELSAKVANGLIDSGFDKGMHAAVYSLNSPHAFVATLGIMRAGGIWLPVNPRNSEASNAAILAVQGCDAMFYQERFAGVCERVANEQDRLKTMVCLDSESPANAKAWDHWLSTASAQAPEIPIAGDDVISIPTTGGTTGMPKGVMHSNRNFCAINHMYEADFARFPGSPTLLCTTPMTHAAGRVRAGVFVFWDQNHHSRRL